MAAGWALALSFVLSRLEPKPAIFAGLGAGLALGLVSVCLQVYQRLWWTWLIPAVVQPGLALGLTIIYRYTVESRERQQMRAAFAAYVTPEVTEQITSRGLDLAPGGRECLVSIMFTDVQSFTELSERVTPKELSLILTSYFDEATQCVLAQQGTIIKYVGDSVLAIWGAPVPCPDHAIRTVKAALSINELGKKFYYGHRLVTRIGVNTGMALVGNLGSKFRFDYTVIGASVNYASRLESLNKHLQTTLLIADTTRQLLNDSFHTRCLGRFSVRGVSGTPPVHEVLAYHQQSQPRPAWCATFESGVAAFQRGDLEKAERIFQQVPTARGGDDGPTQFYLKQIERGRQLGHGRENWTGAILIPW
jgi:adenylate cyclase